ncbi:serine hydrolase domain-containing protein [Actinomadura xylanilytica]|uniref:serine hydrolase domain-containing protein n=1 Tax=Actinomadura xylanilytica TaxID=887459 RepID=UPI00255A8696|nr:serine hydrolase domain-containing protein [Actinomadura xylanilytica]MDL4771530.1 serine hydrolase domain-containing protein [Actinomadura xylanilytica]
MFRRTIVATGLAGVTVMATAAPGAAAERPSLRQLVDRLTAADGAPGALAAAEGARRRTVVTSGLGDVGAGTPVPADGHWRIGSITKPFVATVVLQLAGEDAVALDAPVERYLPGVRGVAGVTVRQLLQHTSGLPDYLAYLTPQRVIEHPLDHHEREDLLAIATAHPRLFPPGKGWSYSNTNYLLASMLIEKTTGRPYGEEIERRVLRPLNLSGTSVPGDAPDLPEPHARGYVRPGPGAPLDLTRLNPSVAAGGGNMVSTADDLNRFLAALVRGRLLKRPQMRAMMTTVPTGRASGDEYGLGLQRTPLPCGGHYWGHDGDMIGFTTVAGATTDGRRATVMANLNPGGTEAQDDDLNAALTTALCEAH